MRTYFHENSLVGYLMAPHLPPPFTDHKHPWETNYQASILSLDKRYAGPETN